jgi:2-octaprenylphenol hydroxylase
VSKSAAQFDVIIIGGGMVGATLAAALHDKRLSVALIEPHQMQVTFDNKFDLRVSAITRASQRIFESLGMWQGMQSLGVSPFREMHVWEQPGSSEMHFDSAELSEPYLGHIIENRVMLASMYETLQQQVNLKLISGLQCSALQKQDAGWLVTLQDGSQVSASLLVGADGSRSWLRQQLGMTVRGWDYAQTALVTYVKTEKSHQQTAWQRFLPGGPLAFLPLLKGYSSIVWSTQPQHAEELRGLPERAFAEALEDAYDSRLGAIIETGPRACFPLRFLMAESYIDEHVALVGDAAHTIHPLAGQGVNLGLSDAASLAEVIIDALNQRQPINSHKVLRRYERWRRSENLSMLAMVDQIQRLFTTQPPVLQWARNTGMGLVNRLAPVKHEVIQHAMGVRGDLPRIARS